MSEGGAKISKQDILNVLGGLPDESAHCSSCGKHSESRRKRPYGYEKGAMEKG